MATMLWKPSPHRIKNTNMYRFMQLINDTFGCSFREYDALYQWSIENIPDFWSTFWEFADIKHSRAFTTVIDDKSKMPGALWFQGAYLNFAENLLRYTDDRIAIIFKGEAREIVSITFRELYDEVARLARSLRDAGIQKGDRVVGFMPNMPQTIVAMLAATSLGAIWSSCSPDFGIKGVLDRFGQIQPKVVFTANGYSFKGKKFNSLDHIAAFLKDLPSIEKVIVVPYTEDNPDIGMIPNALLYHEFIASEVQGPITFEQLPFNHPLYIMFTSGTTGLPKCMVQSAGGILLHHLKELILHTDLKREDNIFYFTTCGWMMWNWLVTSLAAGATITLFDGNPFYPDPGALWQLAQDEKISVFGTSAGYIAALMDTGCVPGNTYDLSALRTVCSTGSPLSVEAFEWVYQNIKKDVQLASISGGSDINGCFALGNTIGPVYAGELQCRGLAMSVASFDENGNAVYNQKGELVCTRPFPSMPIYFWNDPDHTKYRDAYFTMYPGVWRHGDFIEIREDTGGVIIYGRSDATLNPGGVRIGTAEIYRQMEAFKEIADSLVIGQDWHNDVRVILFVKMAEGAALTDALQEQIRKTIRQNASPRHVPAKIIAIGDIPYTLNMKKVEVAVKKIIQGEHVLNRDALRNPESLELYKDLLELTV